MRFGVIGSRDLNGVEYANFDYIEKVLKDYPVTALVSGGGRGVERLIEQWAKKHDVPLEVIPPNIKRYGETEAFTHRNRKILSLSDILIIFWNGKPNAAIHPVNDSFNKKKRIHIIPLE